MEVINIKEPFWTAGLKFNWPGNSVGLGIDVRLLKGTGKIFVKVGTKEKIYELEKAKARQFVKKYNTYHTARTVTLGIIAWNIFQRKDETNSHQKTLWN